MSRSAARSQRLGVEGESTARASLRRLGVRVTHRIATDVSHGGRGGSFYRSRVPGDLFGLTYEGRGVLAEVKSRATGRLGVHDLLAHQRAALAEWAAAGGVALVILVTELEVSVFRFPVPGWVRGSPLTHAHPDAVRKAADLLYYRNNEP